MKPYTKAKENKSYMSKKQNIYLLVFPNEGNDTQFYSFRWRFINDTYEKIFLIKRETK